ncbi:hypothetical protein ScPMuIL_001836 [Solemya velum]
MEGRLAVARLPPLAGGKNPSFPDRGGRFEGLTGPSYRLNDMSHPLPAPQSLKPYIDTRSGEMDTWPAHASGHSIPGTSVKLSKNKSLILVSEEESGKTHIIPKPKFLDQLESYLKKELRTLGVTKVMPNELRLQAHREVFEYLIEDFKTYKSLLSAIKNEYEMMMSHQRQQIRELEPLKQMLVTVSEQCDQKVMAMREDEKQEIIDLKAENKRLCYKIQSLHNEKEDLRTQVNKMQDELAEEYQRYREECDARKMLLSDINDLRYQQEDTLLQQGGGAADDVQDDPVTLKIALKKAREGEKEASLQLNNMIANYVDLIPRREYELLEAKHKQMAESSELLQDQFEKLNEDFDVLKRENEALLEQRDKYYKESETLRRSSTPRPDWDRCADHINGGMVRWKDISSGKTSNELVEVLLAEIAAGGVVDTSGAEFFDAQGTGPSVPKYLRYEGNVRNRHLGKRDCLLLIRDIWREKAAHDAEKADGVRDSMADFLHSYLQRRFSLEQMVVEWGYNLHDACQRYSHDDQIGLFWGVLEEEIDEEVYHNSLQVITKLLNQLTKVDMDHGNQGKLAKEEFQVVLESYLTGVDADSLTAMVKAAELELETKDTEELDYKTLFLEDDEGQTGPFLDEVKKWLKHEKVSYVEEIKTQLEGISTVSVDDLKRAICMADQEIDNMQMDRYLTWSFRTFPDKLHDAEPLEISKLIDRLQNGNLSRIGRK